MTQVPTPGVDAVLARMLPLLARLEATQDPNRFFLATYSRTTRAVGRAIADGRFEDPEWVDRWDVAFAELYLEAFARFEQDPSTAPRPWRAALAGTVARHPLQLVLLGMNAHINYDLPQALLAVIAPEEFADERLMAGRERDHQRIDAVLASRVAAEDAELEAAERRLGRPRPRSLADRVLQPVNRAATSRFLAEARRKVWLNSRLLDQARTSGPDVLARRLAELEALSAARIADLLSARHVVPRLAVGGFGVVLPPW